MKTIQKIVSFLNQEIDSGKKPPQKKAVPSLPSNNTFTWRTFIPNTRSANPRQVSPLRHPKRPNRLLGDRFSRTFTIFCTVLLLESMVLQAITTGSSSDSTPDASGQVAGQTTGQPASPSESKTKPITKIINTQARAASPPAPTPVQPEAFRSPLQNYVLTQRFSHYHPAIDMAATHGSPIFPIASGEVVATGYILAGGGLMVQIKHRDGYMSYYAHLSSIHVTRGHVVQRQQIIGRVGSTGWSTGPHLHLIIQRNGQSLNPLAVIN